MSTTFDELDHPRDDGGRFSHKDCAEQVGGLAVFDGPDDEWDDDDDGTVMVYDAQGDPCYITPGSIDADAQEAYTTGQCLALAKAMSDRGMRIGAVMAGGGLYWEQETTKFHEYDSVLFAHAFAFTDDGEVLDINGHNERGEYLDRAREVYGSAVLVEFSPEQLDWMISRPWVVPQDVATAATLVDPLLDGEADFS